MSSKILCKNVPTYFFIITYRLLNLQKFREIGGIFNDQKNNNMKIKHLVIMSAIVATLASCSESNPFLRDYTTYRQTPPFAEVKVEHFKPAFLEGIKQQEAEIEAIVNNPEEPTFENTVEALEKSGEILGKVMAVFSVYTNSEMTDELMAVEAELMPILSEHYSNISLNEKYFARVKALYDNRQNLGLNGEQMRMLEESYEGFVNSGATLQGADRDKCRELSARLSQLTMTFGQNALKATNAYNKHITDIKELEGMPQGELDKAASKAKKEGLDGWVFDLSTPSYLGVLTYCKNRELRKEMYLANNSRAVGGEFDNTSVIKDIVNTRLEMAKLFGYKNYAEYSLKDKMAKNSENVYKMLDQLREAYFEPNVKEHKAVQDYINRTEAEPFVLAPWDWSYYSNKLQTELFDINDEILRPYFELDKVKQGVFGLANKLYGIRLEKNDQIQVWNDEVEAFEVFDKDGSFIGVLYTDFFPRDSKRAGAWMSDIVSQCNIQGQRRYPFITLTTNFSPATEDKPALLTFDEVTTFLHEFGHCLHGLLSNVSYPSLAGTNVARDFVELPSQLMENWAYEKEFLSEFAYHYQTNELIPMQLIQKIKDAGNFNVARNCCRQLSFGYLDMAYHTITEPFAADVVNFEKEAWKSTVSLPMPDGCCMSTSFTHLFSGGYAAGYYSYKWSEILALDAYDYYTERAVFDTERAASFRENILSKGNTKDPQVLYRQFRGQDASINAMLRHNGIIK